jgi:hypothetical protein
MVHPRPASRIHPGEYPGSQYLQYAIISGFVPAEVI